MISCTHKNGPYSGEVMEGFSSGLDRGGSCGPYFCLHAAAILCSTAVAMMQSEVQWVVHLHVAGSRTSQMTCSSASYLPTPITSCMVLSTRYFCTLSLSADHWADSSAYAGALRSYTATKWPMNDIYHFQKDLCLSRPISRTAQKCNLIQTRQSSSLKCCPFTARHTT